MLLPPRHGRARNAGATQSLWTRPPATDAWTRGPRADSGPDCSHTSRARIKSGQHTHCTSELTYNPHNDRESGARAHSAGRSRSGLHHADSVHRVSGAWDRDPSPAIRPANHCTATLSPKPAFPEVSPGCLRADQVLGRRGAPLRRRRGRALRRWPAVRAASHSPSAPGTRLPD